MRVSITHQKAAAIIKQVGFYSYDAAKYEGPLCLGTGAKLAWVNNGWVIYGYSADGSDVKRYIN